MTNEQALAKLREAVAVTRETYDEAVAEQQPQAYQVGTLRYLLERCERTLTELDGGEAR